MATPFLGITLETFNAAARDLGAHATMLYLYFASNANNFTQAFSPKAVRQSIGMPESTARDQFKKLVAKGYLVHSHGNTYDFYETPRRITHAVRENDAVAVQPSMRESNPPTEGFREINNTYSINKVIDTWEVLNLNSPIEDDEMGIPLDTNRFKSNSEFRF